MVATLGRTGGPIGRLVCIRCDVRARAAGPSARHSDLVCLAVTSECESGRIGQVWPKFSAVVCVHRTVVSLDVLGVHVFRLEWNLRHGRSVVPSERRVRRRHFNEVLEECR